MKSGSLEKYQQLLKEKGLAPSDNPLEATATEHGFLPETAGVSNDEMEQKLINNLPHLAYMVSRPQQASFMGESMLPRGDAALRPYWLRDWQQDLEGFTKVNEYKSGEEVKRKYSVAFVVRPRNASANACWCFSLVLKIPSQKLWARDPDLPDSSSSVFLDLQDVDKCPSIVAPDEPVPEPPLDDMMMVQLRLQCL